MIRFGLRSRRRKRASLGSVALILLVILGFDQAGRMHQRSQEWQGTLARAYTEADVFGSSRSRRKCYWHVRTTEGDVHSRVYARDAWRQAGPGDWVVKRAGELDPVVTVRKHQGLSRR